jgi:hypothetical protein
LPLDSNIPLDIGIELFLPKFPSCLGDIGKFAAIMTVPETTMHKDNCSVFGKNNVRFSRQIFPVESEPVTHSMQE